MLQLIDGLPAGVVGVRGVGVVTKEDYRTVLDPAVEAAGDPLRILFVLGPDFTEYSAGAMLADTEESMKLWRRCGRMAVVTDVGWIRDAVGLFRHALPGELRLFPYAGLDEATAWIAAG
jgi:hypothetical protein